MGRRVTRNQRRAPVRMLRALAGAVVADPGMDTAPIRTHVAVVLSGLQPHVDAAAAQDSRFSVVEGNHVQALTQHVRRSRPRG
jgi:hypothetical protein